MTATVGRPLGWVGRIGLLIGLIVGTFLALVDPFTLLFFLSYSAVGGVLAVRRPSNPVS